MLGALVLMRCVFLEIGMALLLGGDIDPPPKLSRELETLIA